MVYQPPVGARDLLPLDVIQKRWIETRLQQVFHQWGYHRIITSTLERLDTLMAGGAIQRSTVFRVQGSHDEELGLRPELTASIARTVVTRMAGTTHPLRLYYNANVFRKAEAASHNGQQEFYQAGVELLGAKGLLADAEILLLVADCLERLGLNQWSLVLGEAGLTRSLLSVFPIELQPKIRHAIAHLDRLTLEALPLSTELRDRALFLFELRGTPEAVLQKVATLDLDAAQRSILANLQALIDVVQASPRAAALPIILDLSLIQTLDYYTGIIFEVVSQSNQGLQVLGQGGRYDQLLGLYDPQGKSYPGIGFALQLEQIYQVLAIAGQLPQQTPIIDCLVVPSGPPTYPQALAYAQTLRADNNLRVELDLGGRSPAEILDYAQHRRVRQIAWIQENGDAKVETVNSQ